MSKKPLLIIFITVFIDLVGFGIIIPLSPYLARNFGASAFKVGALIAIYSGMQFIFSPIWGRVSDRIGRRPVLLMSILGTAIGHLLFYFSQTFWLLFFARFLAGLFGANISTAMAFIADTTKENERSKSMGLIGAAFGLGFICGPILGGFFAAYGASFPALIAACLSLANFTFAFFVLPESLPAEKRQTRVPISRVKNMIEKVKRPAVGSLMIAQLAATLAMANMEATMFLYMNDIFGWSERKSSYGFAYVGVCIAFTQGYLVRKTLPRYGEKIMLLLGFVLFSVGMFLAGVGAWMWLLAIAMTLLALGNGFINPSLTGSLSLLTPASEQGEVIGANQSMSALARVIGPLIGGYVYMHISKASPFFVAALLALIGLIFVWRERQNLPEAGRIDRSSHSHAH